MPRSSSFPDNAVEIKALDKVYGHGAKAKHALKSVDLSIPRGSFFGLLGPNGAGKSTMINIMAGLVKKTSGSVRLWDRDLDTDERGARCAIGVVPQELNLDPFFTPGEMLEVQAGLYGVPPKERRTDEILAAVGLGDKKNSYARTLSGGMRRRLLVAKALVHTPPILVLDEPTAGVDIELRKQLWAYVRDLNARGTTILLTTHYLEEAEQLCDRIAIIDHGEVVACDTTEALLKRIDAKTLSLQIIEPLDGVPEGLKRFNPEMKADNRLAFSYRPSDADIGEVLAEVNKAGLTIADLTTEETDLEDIFLQLTRRHEEETPTP